MTTTKFPETSRSHAGFAHEHSALAKYLTRKIDAISHVKNQRQIAFEIGYDRPNVISMLKKGEMKLPLDRVPAMARALAVDPAHLFRLALEQHHPEVAKVVHEIFGNVVSGNELAFIEEIRALTDNSDPAPSEAAKERLRKALTTD